MCVKQLIDAFFVFDSIPDWLKTQEMCDRSVSEDPPLVSYFSHQTFDLTY